MIALASRAAEKIRSLAFRHREYSIGILTGPSPFSLSPPAGCRNPVITLRDIDDVPAMGVADPFMIRVDGVWHMFFEVILRGTGKGEIGYAVSRDGLSWDYRAIILREQHHLSYPHVFRVGSEIYMLPETSKAQSVRLYRADPFPTRWVQVATLLTGPNLVDSSIFEHDGRWWMLTQTAPDYRHDTLRLFLADDVLGPWREHPLSPIHRGNPRIARPAGRVLTYDGRIIRFAQDCRSDYGMRVHALEIRRLTPDDYAEVECVGNPFLDGTGRGWSRSGMHHVDAQRLGNGRWIACVDGWTNRLWEP
jgi:hypothetical protein